MDSVHHIWCPLFSQEFQDLPDGAETTLTDEVIDIVSKAAYTGKIGDGKIFVAELQRVIRIRTGEADEAAL